MKNEKLSKHFKRSEFACRGEERNGDGWCCGRSAPVDLRVPPLLERIRSDVSKELGRDTPLFINSAFRCLKYNRSIGSSDGSQHPRGTAADIRAPTGLSIPEMFKIVQNAMIEEGLEGGIGKYPHFIHVDIRGSWAFWDER